jgi:hypothetical protein
VPRMIELIKQSAVPASVMRSAARGALSLPAVEIVEILVFLSTHHTFGDQAKLSIAGYDADSLRKVAADPATPHEVLEYLSSPDNMRLALLPALLENPSVSQSSLLQLALSHSPEVLQAMIGSRRVHSDIALLRSLHSNHALSAVDRIRVESFMAAAQPVHDIEHSEGDVLEIEEEVSRYLAEHAAEIAAEEAKAFELVDLTEDEKRELHAHHEKAHVAPEDSKRMSPLQKIANMNVGDRVQLAMKGNREERYILIRDGCKLVSSAVLECPKLTDQEVETFSAMKNVQENVLRVIAGKRKFMKLYSVVRSLVTNPRCPLDVGLPLLKGLLVQDLRNLSVNKNVPDTLRKVSLKMYKEKSSTKN